MVLTDAGRKRLNTLLVVQEVSQRQLAEGIGWKSHSYLGRILRGEIKTLDTDSAVRISAYLGVGVDDLFVARTSSVAVQSAPRRSAA